jgi:hypothetical protein
MGNEGQEQLNQTAAPRHTFRHRSPVSLSSDNLRCCLRRGGSGTRRQGGSIRQERAWAPLRGHPRDPGTHVVYKYIHNITSTLRAKGEGH